MYIYIYIWKALQVEGHAGEGTNHRNYSETEAERNPYCPPDEGTGRLRDVAKVAKEWHLDVT